MQILKSTRLSVKYCLYYMHYRWIVSIITPVFSVTWSFRNYSNMLICCLGDIYRLTLGAEQSVFLVTAAIVDKIKHIHFQKESKHRFLLTISALPLCSQSAHLFQPLATRAEAWQAIPGVSAWVMTTVRRAYTLQFARRPQGFHGVLEDAQTKQ